MPLNLDIIGKKYEWTPFTYNEDNVILYALGIGAGVDDLDFVYEKNLKVFPTFGAVTDDLSVMFQMYEDVGINLPTVVHAEDRFTTYRTINTSGTIYRTMVLESVYDKGDKGALFNYVVEARDDSNQPLCEDRIVIMDRSAGNFGGSRGPKPERFDPPEGKDPDFRVEWVTSKDQAALYRLSGDKNPLHIDPAFAKKGGLDRPILQGMCTYGFAVRAIVNTVCERDPARFKSFSARFLSMVYPDETLTIEGWEAGGSKYIIQVRAQDGRVVLGNAVAEIV